MESPSTFAWNKLQNFNRQIINKTLKYYTLNSYQFDGLI